MDIRHFDIRSLLDIPEWEKVQDELAAVTGTAIITIDYKGNPVSKHSGRTDFCTVIRENPVSRKRCFKCDSLAGLEAVRLNKPFIYLCHCGIVDVAVPIVVGDRYFGAVMFGQVRIPNDDSDAKVERLVSEISSFSTDDASAHSELMDMYDRLPEMEYRRIEEIAALINAVVKYFVNHALRSRFDEMEYEFKRKSSVPPTFDGEGELADTRLKELSALSRPPRSAEYIAPMTELAVTSPIYPAVLYIRNHLREMTSAKEMAELCHLSPGYFSRLFMKEMGESFTDYLNRTKIEKAKEALRGSAENVTSIAMELGFQDASYFVKVFKKFEGVTPSVYRKSKY